MLRHSSHHFFFCIAAFILATLWSCTSDKKTDSAAIKKEIKSREIKKVTEAEIVNKVHELGKSIALTTKKTLGRSLQNALQKGGVENAVTFCNLVASPVVDSLSLHFDAKIRRVTLKPRNPYNAPNEIEMKIMEAYDFQQKNSLALAPNVQPLDNNEYLFTKPILVESALCLTCHGTSENGLQKETEDFLRSKYPDDKATGYAIGDLRGMWSIIFSKKKVVQSM